MLWLYVAAAVVVVVAVYLVARKTFYDVQTWARFPFWASNPLFLSVFLLAALVLAGWATAVSANGPDARMNVIVQSLFIALAVLVVIVAYLVYKSHSFLLAFYLSVLGFVLALAHGYCVVSTGNQAAVLGVVPLIVLTAVTVYLGWYVSDESSDAPASAIPVFNAQ